MEQNVLFSVIIPIYNGKDYICNAVNSVLSQSAVDYEMILVDDGSTDGSGEICDEYAAENKRIRVIHKENGGLLSARRAGLKASAGQYIIHLDVDDWLADDSLSKLKEVIMTNNPDVIIYDYSRVEVNGNVPEKTKIFSVEEGFVGKREIVQRFVEGTRLNPMWIKCANRHVIDIEADYSAYGKLNMAEDELQTAALLEKTERFYYFPEPLYQYRITGNSISRTFKLQNAVDSVKSKKRVEQMLVALKADQSLFSVFYGMYVRCVLSYLIDASMSIRSQEEFMKHKQKVIENGIPLTRIKVNTVKDRMALELLKSNSCHLYRIIGKIYNV